MKPIFILGLLCLCASSPFSARSQGMAQDDDSTIWHLAQKFTTLFNSGDTLAMQKLLPDAFMLQWMHENFMGKRTILKTMADAATRVSLSFKLSMDAGTVITYSDDGTCASLNAAYDFTDPDKSKALPAKNVYGLCIMYFQKINGSWVLKTVHLDLHCSICGA